MKKGFYLFAAVLMVMFFAVFAAAQTPPTLTGDWSGSGMVVHPGVKGAPTTPPPRPTYENYKFKLNISGQQQQRFLGTVDFSQFPAGGTPPGISTGQNMVGIIFNTNEVQFNDGARIYTGRISTIKNRLVIKGTWHSYILNLPTIEGPGPNFPLPCPSPEQATFTLIKQ